MPTVLDLNQVVAAVVLEPGSGITLRNVGLRGFASPDQVNASTWPYYQNFAFVAWPSIVIYPDARVSVGLPGLLLLIVCCLSGC
jgi:hypothetical protein